MYRQLSSRNQRTKGFRVKHALQVCVLIAVCVWLLYQVKHSHDKRQALEESSGISTVVESGSELLRFGRKDIPLVETDQEDVKTEETHDEEGSEDSEAAETETKMDENEVEDEARGTREDTIDESDQEGADEGGHEEDTGDENERDVKRDDHELSSNQDKETEANTQVTREVNYNGDDASSAVVRHSEATESESGNQGSGSSNEEKTEDIASHNGTIEANADIKSNDIKVNESDVPLENTEVNLSNNTNTKEIENGADSMDNSTTLESLSSSEQPYNSSLENPFNSLLKMLNKSAEPVIAESYNSSSLESTDDLNSLHDKKSIIDVAEGSDNALLNTTNGESFHSEKLLTEQMVTSNTTDGVEGSEGGIISSSIISKVGDGSENETTVQPVVNDLPVKVDATAQEEKDDSGNTSEHESNVNDLPVKDDATAQEEKDDSGNTSEHESNVNDLPVKDDATAQEEKDDSGNTSEHESNDNPDAVTREEKVAKDTAVRTDAGTTEETHVNEDVVKVESNDSSGQSNTVAEDVIDTNEGADQREPNDVSAKIDTVTEEEKDARTDLSTLPEAQEDTKIEDIAAE